ncbi:hypothetical protein B0H13DRAFT_1879664 [Mycena leptocephala]|nr:hypothetical protein B0H13DRAFT_1879664 [Mycena leptocephala]
MDIPRCPADPATHRWGYKKGHDIIRRMPCFRGALGPAHPAYPQDIPAALQIADLAPVSIDAPKLAYSAAADKAIDTCLRNFISTTFHSLNVYGVKNLKVADVSIPPANVHSNTYSLAIAIGEYAAVIIAKELGGSMPWNIWS